MRDVDLSLFKFDYDLTFYAFFLNGHELVYGRYGGRDGGKADARLSTASLVATMKRALTMHARRKNEKPARRGARQTVRDLPYFKRVRATGKQAPNCIHCHHIGGWIAQEKMVRGTFDKRRDTLLYPLPENIGFSLERDSGITVKSVKAGTPAARAGLRVGDQLLQVGETPILSQGDVIHRLNDVWGTVRLPLVVWRKGAKKKLTVSLSGDAWRKTEIHWRSLLWSMEPLPKFWAPECTPAQRRQAGVPASQLALRVKWVPKGPARAAGLRNGDIIVATEGQRARRSTVQQQVWIRMNKKVGDILTLTILRGGKERTLRLKLRSYLVR